MLNIAICDDDEFFVSKLENLLFDYLNNKNFNADLHTFINPQDLFKYLNTAESIDLLFLDIEFNDVNGVEIGNRLRKELHNDLIQIVFVSSKEKYAMQLFSIRPFDFLVKPIDYNKVEGIMDEYNRIYRIQQNYFEYHVGKQIYKIDEQYIIYMKSTGRKITMVTCIGDRVFYGKLSDVIAKLNANSFYKIHKSFVINTRYVSEYNKENVVMTNGAVIPVSRSIQNQLNKFIIDEKWGDDYGFD